MAAPLVALLTDYGPGTEHVGALHALLARDAAQAGRVDLAHDIPPGDVRWGATVLARLVTLLPARSVVVAVVDPGVGTARRAVVVRTGAGPLLTGPDNGLLGPAATALGGPVELVEVEPPAEAPATFHGRDLFVPVAVALLRGVAPADLGAPADPAGLRSPARIAPEVGAGRIATLVAGWDRFGNVATTAGPGDLARAGLAVGDALRVTVGEDVHWAPLARTFGDVPEGGLLVHLDSHGVVALAVNGDHAASLLGVREGAEVVLTRA